jgi:3-oxoacyl-(acyl-carrier-protein) synthase
MEVFIAGSGIISAIGNNVLQNLESLSTGTSGIKPITVLSTHYASTLPAGEVKLHNKELAEMAGLKANISRTTLLSMVAAKEALLNSHVTELGPWRTGFISANTVGGMDLTENFMKDFLADSNNGSLSDVIHHDSGAATEMVARELGIKECVTTISTACSSSANAIMYGARLIKNNVLDVVLAGGVDCMLRFTLNGFNALMILDSEPCKPFDENRKGLNLGEGAGYVVLVSEKVAAQLSQKPIVKLSGYANANDAFHQTASSAEGNGNYLAMQGALDMSGLKTTDIDYINLHGTGTANNDLSEGIAVQRIFGDKVPPVSSTKAFTGHTLGASGAIEAIFSTLAIEKKMIFPNLRFATPIKELGFSPVKALLENQRVNHVVSNSFGFGGNCSSLIFSRV